VAVAFTPSGSIAATNTQAAIEELDTEKLSKTGGTLTGNINLPSINGGQLAGFRNRIINGACDIAQRGLSVAVPNNTFTYGGPDRFMAANSNGGGQFTQSQASLTFQGVARNSVRHTVNTAITSRATTNRWEGIQQFIEGFNAFDLRGKQSSLSFIFNTNVSGSYSVAIRDGNSSQSYVTTITAVANTPQLVKIPVAAIPTAANVPISNGIGLILSVGFLNTGVFQTETLNAWQTGNFISASGATNWGATAGNFIELTELQIEEGSVATPFERRSYGAELALCQRYFYRSGGGPVLFQSHGVGVFASVFFDINLDLPIPMRSAPTMTTGLLSQFQVSDGINAFTPTSLVLQDPPSLFSTSCIIRAGGTFTAGRAGRLLTNNSTASLDFLAEL
jgi:hypothetical protein